MQWHDRIGRRLKLRDLHILLAVVQRGSMAKAAAELAISQPAVSKAIADMEYTLGLRLLDRTRHGIEPTTYGRVLIKRGTTIFDELKQATQELDFLADPTVGELRIGSSESMAAQDACQLHLRKLHLSMATSWLSLARQDEAIDPSFQGTGYRPALRREDRAA